MGRRQTAEYSLFLVLFPNKRETAECAMHTQADITGSPAEGRSDRDAARNRLARFRSRETKQISGAVPNVVNREWSFVDARLRRESGGGGATHCGTAAAD